MSKYTYTETKYNSSSKEKLNYWECAIGLNKVDNLSPSKYLIQLANEHIKGNLTTEEVRQNLYKKYNEEDSDELEYECDMVSSRIVDLLDNENFSLSVPTLLGIHKYLFQDIYSFAGEIRDKNLTKNEEILNGETVKYSNYYDILSRLEYDISLQKTVKLSKLSEDELVKNIATFTSNIWQNHPFREGNTRATAMFIEQYLRSYGLPVKNDIFTEHSLYFRNCLVRSNYNNWELKVDSDSKYLENFFAYVIGVAELEISDLNIEKNIEKMREEEIEL